MKATITPCSTHSRGQEIMANISISKIFFLMGHPLATARYKNQTEFFGLNFN